MLRASAIVLTFCLVLASWPAAQTSPSVLSPIPAVPWNSWAVSAQDPGTSGSFTFNESAGGRYRLTGKSVRKYAGRMVRLVGGPQGKKLSIRGGLWPSPNVAAQAGAIDPAQASIARQPGGTSGTGGFDLPEFRVVSVRGVDGACK